jgi:hypothetical protein
MGRMMTAWMVVVGALAFAAPALAQQTKVENYQIVKKEEAAPQPAFENSLVSGVYTSGDIDDPDKAFYGLSKPDHMLYQGIIPQVRDRLPHQSWYTRQANRARKANRLTWIGFQKMGPKSRVFIQTGRLPNYEVVRGASDNELLVVLKDTKPSFYNFYRDMDCRWQHRAISHVRSWRKGKDTYISIKLLSNVEFAVANEGDYVYVDFNDGFLDPGTPNTPTGKPEQDKTIYADPNG